ncbi:Alpha/beta hydrolase fold-3 domain protein [Chthoniobacter flavus Ellin428]|uniref:Alpha/beta hydrolase fold-3 domain protein n=1 Tax=Chthoniobacter flavus Ellin428 TaxID=497964 RepID=B4D506_9BACT|nr:alpha/beta hydrolase [Chthoniobacter flavus]EDY18609.1 Alpha/beta hydrolase fold-3 domain protein [Chthoniobacter flavus Ellin428]TCO90935.1 acetyl esterase/lipase [Chthoniobacter flavus]
MKIPHFLPALLLSLAPMLALAQAPQPAAKAAKPAPVIPDSIKADLNIVYGHTPEQELKMDVYRPKSDGDPLPACVLVHGGGWVEGDKERFSPLAIGLAQRGYVVANVEYRLGPVAKYPAAVQDCNLAVRYVRTNATRFGADSNRIGAWGGSAGGHLVGLLAAAPTETKFLTGDDRNVSAKVRATVVMAGPMELNTEKSIENYRKQKENSYGFKWIGKLYDDAPELYKEASPITYFSKDTGPILFLTGSLDNPARDTAPMDKLKSLGVPTQQVVLADGKHGCWMRAPWQEQCLEAVDTFFKSYLK